MTQAVTIRECTNPIRDWLRDQPTIETVVGADSGLDTPAVYSGAFPKTVAWPAIKVQRVGGAPDGPLDRPLIQFDVVGAAGSGGAAEIAAGVLISLLESTPASTELVDGLLFMGARTQSVLWAPDPASDQPRLVVTSEITVKAVP